MREYFEEQQGQPGQPAGHHLLPPDRDRAQAAAGGQGPDQGPGRLDRAGAAAGRRLRHRRAALLAGPGLEGPGRLAQLVPPGRDGAGVRAGRVRAQARRDLRPGRDRRSVTTSSRWSGPSRPRSRPATSCWCRQIDSANMRQRPRPGRRGCTGAGPAGAAFDSLQRLYHDPSERARGGRRAGDQAAGELRQGHRCGRFGSHGAGLHHARAPATATSSWCSR